MSQLEGGELIVKVLKEEGVKYIFTLCGGSIIPIYDACLDYGIKVIGVRNEQTASYMADAWGRLTRQPGVCAVTSGPGHTNALTGLATAYLAHSPMILISGHCYLEDIEKDAFQEIDQVGMAAPVTKWSKLVTDVKRIPDYMATAFRQATSGKPGPVHLSIPRDIMEGKVEESEVTFMPPAKYRSQARIRGDSELIKAAVQLLTQAEKPAVIVGGGVHWSDANAELKEFIELTQVPLFTKEDEMGCVAENFPFYFGLASRRNNDVAFKLEEADVVLVLGLRLDSRSLYGQPPFFGEKMKLIRVDLTPEELGKNREHEIGIVGDMKSVLVDMIEEARKINSWGRTAWLAELRTARENFFKAREKIRHSDAQPVHPLRLCHEIEKFLGTQNTLVTDGGDIGQWAKVAFYSRHPNHWLTVGAIGGVGCGIPFALAAQLARPQHRTILLSGDGSFGFGAMEFDIAIKNNIPIVAVLSNDEYWGIIRHPQIARYGEERAIGTELGFTRYDKIVEALGGYGEFVENPNEIGPALERALDSGVPACVNVMTEFANPMYSAAAPSSR
ncbi:thiamine pyrophosphate-binding protein [bacterium]|nr:thiamine pyrophosphate-binding protein [bacterium]